MRKRLSRSQLLHFTSNLPVELIGMEACGGAHFLDRALQQQGHKVRRKRALEVATAIENAKQRATTLLELGP